MRLKSIQSLLVLIVFSFNCAFVWSQDIKVDKICASNRFIDQCTQLQRGNSEVECQWVQDSIECAQRIINGTADFGIFSAESTLHLASLAWEGMTVIKEIRHQDRLHEVVDFESVVLVKSSFTGGLRNLAGLKYCHPGFFYDKTQKWSERFLKQFERTVAPVDCTTLSAISSPAELETRALSDFFGSSCRPGIWSMDPKEDAILKQKYPNLCSLCGGENCQYPGNSGGHHAQALDCLNNFGDVAYVSAQDAKSFLLTQDNSTKFLYLCPNGTTSSTPCTWLRQPWKTIIAKNTRNLELAPKITQWLSSTGAWASAINEIIKADNHYPMLTTIQTPRDYVRAIREIPLPVNLCNTQSNWCAISAVELDKCEVIRHAGITTGVQPTIECRSQVSHDVACLNEIAQLQSDFTGIDSSLGFLARKIYNLTNALYAETENDKYSSAGVVIKDGSQFTRFENLKNSKACFQEFDGIASIAFVNIGKGRGFMNSDDCNYGRLLSQFFSESCAPGARDVLHDPSQTNPENLCSLCKSSIKPGSLLQPINQANIELHQTDDEKDENEPINTTVFPIEGSEINFEGHEESAAQLTASCEADNTNRFYNNKGALQCLAEVGDVAILELQSLNQFARELNLNPNNFRVLCQNGSLSATTGFTVDSGCALSTIVDGEIVVRRNDRKTQGIINALLSFDRYLNLDPDFKMYNIFASQRHLLFKDSMLGLVTGNEVNLAPTVDSYIQLFKNTDSCVNASTKDGNSARIMLLNIYLLVTLLSFYSLRYMF